MGYCTLTLMRAILPKTITIGSTNVTTPTITQQGGVNTLDIATAQRYIDLASQEIDSRLAPIYVVPLRRIRLDEAALIADAKKGAVSVSVEDNSGFRMGRVVKIKDDLGSELNEVGMTPETTAGIYAVGLANALTRDYRPILGATMCVLEYSDPIPSVCARIAVSLIIDRQFIAEQAPDVSNYGKTQRTLANNDIDGILTGAIRLNGEMHAGRRFVRNSLRDAISTTVPAYQQGTGKEI